MMKQTHFELLITMFLTLNVYNVFALYMYNASFISHF